MCRRAVVTSLLVVVTAMAQLAAQQPTVGRGAKAVVPSVRPARHTGFLTTIQGNALDSTNRPLPNVEVRLRDARFGRIVETELTDKSGMFVFKVTDPGSYIVELLSADQTLLAASEILNVNAGDAVSAIVKLPFRIPPFAGLLGNASTPAAALLASQAAATGITAAVPTSPISPNR
jgi:hypothetical protein